MTSAPAIPTATAVRRRPIKPPRNTSLTSNTLTSRNPTSVNLYADITDVTIQRTNPALTGQARRAVP